MALLSRSHGLNKFMIFTSSDSIVHVFQSCIGTQQWYVNKISPVSYLMFFFHGTAVRDGQTWQSIAIATLWYNLHLSIHSGMGWTVGTGCSKWDTSVCIPVRPFPPMVQWDGMDSGHKWDTLVQSQTVHSILGWDRQYSKWDTLVWFQSVYFVPWWNGMGWTVGTQMGHFGTIPDHLLGFPMYYWTSVGNPGHVCVVHPDCVLIKTSMDNRCWQTERLNWCTENGISQSLWTSGKRKAIYYCKQHPWGEEASYVASSFLGKCASITAVDLIQRKPDLISHPCIKIIMVSHWQREVVYYTRKSKQLLWRHW